MSGQGAPGRQEVIAILAALGDRPVEEVGDQIGSLELTWLITQMEQRYGITLDLSDEDLAQMMTVSGAVAALREALASEEQQERSGVVGTTPEAS
jgi:acyl carrier protein